MLTPVRLLTALALALVLNGCDSGSSSTPTDCDNGLSGFFVAEIDGTAFSANCFASSFTDGVIVIAGSEVNGGEVVRRIELIVTGTSEGTYPIGTDAEATLTMTAPNRTYEATSGQVVITQAFIENPAGGFSFTGQSGSESVAVTGGSFDVYR